MAKRQQQNTFGRGDFLPTKALQPQQQIFDQYNAPKQFIAPQSELMEIGSALAGLSPTLQKFEDRNRAEDAAEMQIAASKMSIDELRAASKRDFIGLQKKGVIPEGASPWAKVALLEAAGRRLVTENLSTTLYDNMEMLTAAESTVDPREFANAEFQKLGIDSLYAQKSALDAFTPLSNAFTSQVTQQRNAKIAKENKDIVADEVYRIATDTYEYGLPSGDANLQKSIKSYVDGKHKDLGPAFRDETFAGLSYGVKQIAEDDLDKAAHMLTVIEDIKIGQRTIGEDFAAEIDALEDEIIDIHKKAQERQGKGDEDRRTFLLHTANDVSMALWAERQAKGRRDHLEPPNSEQSLTEFRERLTAEGVTEAEMSMALGNALSYYETVQQKSDPDDDVAMSEVIRMVSPRSDATLKDVQTFIADNPNALSPETAANVIALAAKNKDVSAQMRTLQTLNAELHAGAMREVNTMLTESMFEERTWEPDQAHTLRTEYSEEYEAVVEGVVTENPGMPDHEKLKLVRDGMKDINTKYLELIKDGPEADISGGEFSTDIENIIKERRYRESGFESAPKALSDMTEDWATDETDFAKAVLAQARAATPEDKAKFNAEIFTNAKVMLAGSDQLGKVGGGWSLREQITRFQGPGRESGLNELFAAKARVGLTEEEVVSGRLIPGFVPADEPTKEKLVLKDDQLSPAYVLLFDGMETPQDFDAFVEAYTQGDAEAVRKANAIHDALPATHRMGVELLLKIQGKTIRKYRLE